MKLSTLLQPWISIGERDVEIKGIQNDSRHIQPGDVFIAYPGAASDGRVYIESARQQGAKAVIYDPEQLPATLYLPTDIPCLPIPNLAQQLAVLANRFYAAPSKALSITGVTGTNGKTTIAYQLTQAHQWLGQSSAYIGTLGHGILPQIIPLKNTTPDALCLQYLLHHYRQEGVKQICMEVSSHALSEHRVDEIVFREAIYTNLSHEHLDYHQTMQAYATAKATLFAKDTLEWVVLNKDDAYTAHMAAVVPHKTRILTYGIEQTADVKASACQLHMHGSEFIVQSPWGEQTLTIPSLGLFNIYNSLAVYTSLLAHGYPIQEVVAVMAKLKASPGRMEIVAQKPCVVVDYAHTPAALDNVLKTVLDLKSSPRAKVWVVFGCGGDRDKTKRPLMGRIASTQADQVILTSDNPRHEDPDLIIQDIVAGIPKEISVHIITDRHAALQFALQSAAEEDIVLIAGKGHEDYQIIGDKRSIFSDQEEVRRVLQSKHI